MIAFILAALIVVTIVGLLLRAILIANRRVRLPSEVTA